MTEHQSIFGAKKNLKVDKTVASLFNVEIGSKKRDPRVRSSAISATKNSSETGSIQTSGPSEDTTNESGKIKLGSRKRSKSDVNDDDVETGTTEEGLKKGPNGSIDEMEKQIGKSSKKKQKRSKNTDNDVQIEDLYLQSQVEAEPEVGTKKANATKPKEAKENTTKAGAIAKESSNETNEEASEVSGDKDSDDDSDDQEQDLVHESLLPNVSEVEKALSTVFVGNVPKSVITDKKVYKQFSRFFSEAGKIQSIRFRSIAFSEILPRKVAFTLKKLHTSRANVNAYIAFESREAAKKALAFNGRVFADYHLRVDSVAHPAKQDNKKCVFIGNMDFDESEESLWRHFSGCGEIEAVRLVRDSKTNVGKGFGYVQFKDSTSVTKALLLDGKKMTSHEKPDKARALRVSRAKNISKKPSNGSNSKLFKDKRLTADKKSELGRARAVVGKAGKAKIEEVIEGHRAAPGEVIKGLTGGKKKATKGGKKRITSRSQAFKQKS